MEDCTGAMGIYNLLFETLSCPRCGRSARVDLQFRIGLLDLIEYEPGDSIRWHGRGIRAPRERSPDGRYESEGWATCPSCHQDFVALVTVVEDVIQPSVVLPLGDAETP